MDFVFELLDLIQSAHVDRFPGNFGGWLGVFLDKSAFQVFLLIFKLLSAAIAVCHLVFEKLNFLIFLLDLLLQSFKIFLVLLFKLPVFKLRAAGTKTTATSLLCSRRLRRQHKRGQRFCLECRSDLLAESRDIEEA